MRGAGAAGLPDARGPCAASGRDGLRVADTRQPGPRPRVRAASGTGPDRDARRPAAGSRCSVPAASAASVRRAVRAVRGLLRLALERRPQNAAHADLASRAADRRWRLSPSPARVASPLHRVVDRPGLRHRRLPCVAPFRPGPVGAGRAGDQLCLGAHRPRPPVPARPHRRHAPGARRSRPARLAPAPPRSGRRWQRSRPWLPRRRPTSRPAPTCPARGPCSARRSARSAAW